MTCFCPTIEGFKAQFPSAFPYLPEYIYGKAYFKGDVVYVYPNFYKSLVDANLSDVTDTNKWALYPDLEANYCTDSLISEAFGEAKINFDPSLFETCNDTARVFYYLAAHYLVIDINANACPFALGVSGLLNSKSVGSVSASFGLPQWVLNDPNLGLYAQTQFGLKYLSLLLPYMTGQIMLVQGKTTYLDD